MQTAEKKGFSVDQVINVIEGLASSQGFYSRLYAKIQSFTDEEYEAFKSAVEKENFKDLVDVVLFFEC